MSRDVFESLINSASNADRTRSQAWAAIRDVSSQPLERGRTLASVVDVRLSGTRTLTALRADLVRNAYRDGVAVAATSLLVPPEIFWAAGLLPFNWEMFASLLATDPRISELNDSGSEATPRCSFFNALKGTFVDGMLPAPDFVVSSSAYCSGIGYLCEELASGFGVEHIHLEVPQSGPRGAVEYVADQLDEVFSRLCEITGVDTFDRIRRLRWAVSLSAKARRVYAEMENTRREQRLDLALEPLLWHFQFFPFWGTQRGVEICEQLLANFEEFGRSQSGVSSNPRVAMFSLFPYGRTDLWTPLVEAGVASAFEGINWLGDFAYSEDRTLEKYDKNELLGEIAGSLIGAPMRSSRIQQDCEEAVTAMCAHDVEGLLVFSHEQCQMIGPRLHAVEETASRAGLGVCVINGDCLLGVPTGPAGLRLRSFLAGLRPAMIDSVDPEAEPAVKKDRDFDLRIGVDFGSGFSKFVAVDPEGQILDRGACPSGIDYPGLLSGILGKMPVSRNRGLALAGVGADNPAFDGLVDHHTSEMTALIEAVRFLFPDETPLLVVDVGTQDIKVLKFTSPDSEPWMNTNKSCGAGTGCVLTQILDRWQQSEPAMTFERLDELAFEAEQAEPINTTCGVFAVTNVVSGLTTANGRRRNEIIRGVYSYVASQAIRHLPLPDRKGGRLLVVGGLARHRTLQQILEAEGFDLIQPPEGISAYHMVALGAALML